MKLVTIMPNQEQLSEILTHPITISGATSMLTGLAFEATLTL
jgi:hypothetical protein